MTLLLNVDRFYLGSIDIGLLKLFLLLHVTQYFVAQFKENLFSKEDRTKTKTKAMANNLARIFGTEEDKVNCSFYFKIGACRHGERCSRLHMKPNFSQTLLLAHFYMPPPPGKDGKVVDDSEHYEDFYEDVLDEMIKFGDVEELVICENLGDHMVLQYV